MKKDKSTKTISWDSFQEMGNPENVVLNEEGKKDSLPSSDLLVPVRVYIEKKKRGGKKVTVIKGLHLSNLSMDNLLKKMKIKMGVGGSLNGSEIILQGDQRQKVIKDLQLKGFTNVKNAGS